jgi:hypothetical protein
VNVIRQGEFFVATHIPGPTHNYLALRFGESRDTTEPTVVELSSERGGPVDAARVVPEVLAALAEANAALGTAYKVDEIRFRRDDSPRNGIYRSMTLCIVEACHEGVQDR